MVRNGNIVRYTSEELDAMIARGESKTDWAAADAMSREEVERLADEEDGPLPEGWEATVRVGNGLPARAISIRLDAEILDWFKAGGRGYQTRINDVLRDFVRVERSKKAVAGE